MPEQQPAAPRRVINAWGTATPWGVSRSPPVVAEAVAAMLQRFVAVADLQQEAGVVLAQWSGAPTGCVTHCTAAAITLSVAACMTGMDGSRIAQLPDAGGMRRRVPMLASHQVNYGHSIAQAVRLSGAEPVACESMEALEAELARGDVACALSVESHLAAGSGTAVTGGLVALAHGAGVPLVLDAAAQDWRVRELVAGDADLILLSAQKYLAGPTAGIVIGSASLVAAVDAQHGGIGRAMKPSKESLAGVIAAVRWRLEQPADAWRETQARKVEAVASAAQRWPVTALVEDDPQGNGFGRVWLAIDPQRVGTDAAGVAQRLRACAPAIRPSRLPRTGSRTDRSAWSSPGWTRARYPFFARPSRPPCGLDRQSALVPCPGGFRTIGKCAEVLNPYSAPARMFAMVTFDEAHMKPVCRSLAVAVLLASAWAASAQTTALVPAAAAAEPSELVKHPWVEPPPNRQPEAYFSNLKDGESRVSPFVLRFGLSMRGIVPAGKTAGRAGHHHLLINQPLPLDFKKPLPFTDQYIHFGKGQMETVINLKPGTYTLNLLLADQGHIPYFVFSRPLKLTITAQDPKLTPAAVLGPKRIEILGLADQQVVKGPFRVQFHASGYNIAHREAKVAESGHFRLTLDRAGKKDVLDFREGQTEVWLNPPRGDYGLKLELLDNTSEQPVAAAAPIRLNVSSSAAP